MSEPTAADAERRLHPMSWLFVLIQQLKNRLEGLIYSNERVSFPGYDGLILKALQDYQQPCIEWLNCFEIFPE